MNGQGRQAGRQQGKGSASMCPARPLTPIYPWMDNECTDRQTPIYTVRSKQPLPTQTHTHTQKHSLHRHTHTHRNIHFTDTHTHTETFTSQTHTHTQKHSLVSSVLLPLGKQKTANTTYHERTHQLSPLEKREQIHAQGETTGAYTKTTGGKQPNTVTHGGPTSSQLLFLSSVLCATPPAT